MCSTPALGVADWITGVVVSFSRVPDRALVRIVIVDEHSRPHCFVTSEDGRPALFRQPSIEPLVWRCAPCYADGRETWDSIDSFKCTECGIERPRSRVEVETLDWSQNTSYFVAFDRENRRKLQNIRKLREQCDKARGKREQHEKATVDLDFGDWDCERAMSRAREWGREMRAQYEKTTFQLIADALDEWNKNGCPPLDGGKRNRGAAKPAAPAVDLAHFEGGERCCFSCQSKRDVGGQGLCWNCIARKDWSCGACLLCIFAFAPGWCAARTMRRLLAKRSVHVREMANVARRPESKRVNYPDLDSQLVRKMASSCALPQAAPAKVAVVARRPGPRRTSLLRSLCWIGLHWIRWGPGPQLGMRGKCCRCGAWFHRG